MLVATLFLSVSELHYAVVGISELHYSVVGIAKWETRQSQVDLIHLSRHIFSHTQAQCSYICIKKRLPVVYNIYSI
jgi:hypothetical protein